MKNKIDITDWKIYNLKKDLGFKIYHGQRITKAARTEGNVPLLTAGKINQGVVSYIDDPLCEYNDSITVDMFGNCFYHKGKYSGDDNIYFFINNNISDNSKLYIVSVISKKIHGCFSYIDQFRQNDAENLSVELPTTIDNMPDWKFMDDYIDMIKKEAKKTVKILNKSSEIKERTIDITKWKEFEIGTLFEIKSPKVYHIREVTEDPDGIPYVVRSKFNNGIKFYVKKDEKLVLNPSKVISFGAENSAFFYQDKQYISGRDMYYIDTQNISKNASIFLIACLNNIASKYSYNYGLFPKLLKQEKIKLPVTKDEKPDYDFMDKYIANLSGITKAKIECLKNI